MKDNIVGKRIRELRENAAITQIDFAKILDIAANTLSQYELGQREPNDGIKIEIANYFDVSMDYLMGRTNKRESFRKERENNLPYDDRLKKFILDKNSEPYLRFALELKEKDIHPDHIETYTIKHTKKDRR